jgi:predicted metal-dependent hydrolase
VPGKPLRSPARALPSPPRRPAPQQAQPHRRPLQLELFGLPPQRGNGPLGGLRPASSPGAAAAGPHRVLPLANPDAPRTELLRQLNRLTRGRLRSLALTDNRRTILSVRPGRARPLGGVPLDLRIHRSFLTAGGEVLRAVAAFLESPRKSEGSRGALATIREHFNRHRQERGGTSGAAGPSRRPRRIAVQPVGEVHDLRNIAEEVNRRYFDGRLKVRITWGKASGETAHHCRRTRTSSLQLGSYSYEDRLIRVHRVLDRPGIPRYVVESVVFHELLHADLAPVVRGGKRYFHTPEFRRRERQFRHFERADLWVRENLQDLLRARRKRATSSSARA